MGEIVARGGGASGVRRCPPPASAVGVSPAAAVLLAVATVALSACPPYPHTPTTGTFIEEFEGFPIYHGNPGRPYRVLGPVYRSEAAARGLSPMKRAAVTEARRQGADAIVVGVIGDGIHAGDRPGTTPDTQDGPRQTWQHAMAIAWE